MNWPSSCSGSPTTPPKSRGTRPASPAGRMATRRALRKDSGIDLLRPVDFQEPLRVDGRPAPAAGGGDRLPIDEIVHVSRGENPLHAGFGTAVKDDVSLLQRQLPFEDPGIGLVADRDEDAVDPAGRLRAVLEVFQPGPGPFVLF